MLHSCATCGKVLMLGQPAALNGSVDKRSKNLVNKMYAILEAVFATLKKNSDPHLDVPNVEIREVKIDASDGYHKTQALQDAFKDAVKKFARSTEVNFNDSVLPTNNRMIHGDADYSRIVMTANIRDKNISIELIRSHGEDPGDDWVHIRMSRL
jgi:hypothetical protein